MYDDAQEYDRGAQCVREAVTGWRHEYREIPDRGHPLQHWIWILHAILEICYSFDSSMFERKYVSAAQPFLDEARRQVEEDELYQSLEDSPNILTSTLRLRIRYLLHSPWLHLLFHVTTLAGYTTMFVYFAIKNDSISQRASELLPCKGPLWSLNKPRMLKEESACPQRPSMGDTTFSNGHRKKPFCRRSSPRIGSRLAQSLAKWSSVKDHSGD